MYRKSDIIVYPNGGVCVIEDIGKPEFIQSDDVYYQMRSLINNLGTIYVKVDQVRSKIRTIITCEEAETLIAQIPTMEPIYNVNDKVRDREFNDIIKSCECEQALCMMKGIFTERIRKSAAGKNLCLNDDRNYNAISKLIFLEFSLALSMSAEQAGRRIEAAFTI